MMEIFGYEFFKNGMKSFIKDEVVSTEQQK